MSFKDKKVVVVMPAYNAAKTLRKTYDEVMSQEFVDLVIVVDDASSDETTAIAGELSRAKVHTHDSNLGYGANQKTCYRLALEEDADIVIMLHPDYQYTPMLIPAMVSMIGSGLYHCVLGSRILGGHALEQGMPVWRYLANRVLTFIENVLMGTKLSEFHTGFRAFSRELLERLPWDRNSDDFVFDNQILAQVLWYGYPIAEITCPTRYQPESSSIDFSRSVEYGWGCLLTATTFGLARLGLMESELFPRPVD